MLLESINGNAYMLLLFVSRALGGSSLKFMKHASQLFSSEMSGTNMKRNEILSPRV